MRRFTSQFAAVLALLITVVWTAQASADPLDGEVLKFSQQPMLQTTISSPDGTTTVYNGHDELSTLYGVTDATGMINYSGIAMADDFADEFDSPVVHVTWWGSYLNEDANPQLQHVRQFLIAFESDEPAVPGSFSHPKDVLNAQIVDLAPAGPLVAGSGTFTETKVLDLPTPGEDIYKYNAELHLGQEFFQKPETVYWLKIAALFDAGDGTTPQTQWGWHNRDYTISDPLALAVTPPIAPGERDERIELGSNYPVPVWHFQDDAVSADTTFSLDPFTPDNTPQNLVQQAYFPQNYKEFLDGPGLFDPMDGTPPIDGIQRFSKDLAFQLYTVPEPSSVALMMVSLVALVGGARRRTSCTESCK